MAHNVCIYNQRPIDVYTFIPPFPQFHFNTVIFHEFFQAKDSFWYFLSVLRTFFMLKTGFQYSST